MGRLEELEVFVAIADLGSLVGAARKTGRSAPAVTRILRGLEARLGVRLIERTTRSLALTGAGVRLAASASRVLSDLGDAEAEASGDAAMPRGRLRVTAPLVFGETLLAPILLDYLDRHPQVSVDLSLNDRIVDLVDEGFDLALRIGQLDSSSHIRKQVGVVRPTLVASPAYLARAGTPLVPGDLGSHQWIALGRHKDLPDPKSGWTATHRFCVDQAETAIAAAMAGRGILRTLSYQVAEHVASGRLVRLLQQDDAPALPVQLVFPSSRLMPQRVRMFVEMATPRLAARLDALSLG